VAQRTELDQRLGFLDEVQQRAARELEAAITDLQRLTAQVYTNGGTGAWQAAALLDTQDAMDINRVTALGDGYAGQLEAAKRRAKAARQRATELTTKFALQRADVGTRLAQVEIVELPAAQRDLELARVQAASTLAGASVSGLGIPLASLDAYLRAQYVLARDLPQCGVEWWMIAGIGRVESNHGRYGGAQPSQNGNVAPRIIGIPLDGSPGVAAIRDSDAGLWDGDAVWDHAVGPMQFIPSTWKGYAVDGNGDGNTDPNNLYDAALGTGRYMCRAAGHLGDDGSLNRAYLAYNASQSYAADVLAGARRYQHAGIPAPL
jgi:membrane-bound lytic murein transglycosylase B